MNAELDSQMMGRAIELSQRGFPAPNPHVGCVIARGSHIVGEGWHEFAGGDHAEAAALKQTGESAKGATAYVTLEPCNHYGRTPPCSKALIEAGVERVVIACPDPNPKASGGSAALRQAGVEVEVGLMTDEAAEVNRLFLFAQKCHRPYVIIKAAVTLDGFIARPDGGSKWITGEEARAAGHRLRAEAGCVLVGRETVERDNPALTARIDGVVNQPRRVVLDPRGRLSGREQVFGAPGALWYVGSDQPRLDSVNAPLTEGRFELPSLLGDLFQRGEIGVLVEGGGRTIRGFLEAELAEEIHLFIAPKLFGEGRSWAGGTAMEDLSQRGWWFKSTDSVGEDIHVVLHRTLTWNKENRRVVETNEQR